MGPCINSWGSDNKIPQTGDLNNRNLFSHSSGCWKANLKVPSGLVCGEKSLPGLTWCFSENSPSFIPHILV